ncbi:DoxX family protein [Streptomyces sp. A7024]|uniref:DoxX family protein n=1 Tax=Streptomyces coryli TaxID=1128680 RepID=A0A6G4TZW0_9ACTN|nr:DoxX family protein [Streptomyces coryli]NGN65515.1 DoxX family protein [Streptomyces coryli]
MFVATVVITAVLAASLAASVALKLSHKPDVVEGYARVHVPEERLNALAGVLACAVAGLIAGLFWAPIGIAAATGVTVYFLLACGAHVRFRDTAHLGPPVVNLLLGAAALTLRLITY